MAVRRPPVTRSISSALRSRAPLRINTLFWSFIFFLLSSLFEWPKLLKAFCPAMLVTATRLKMVAPPRRHTVQQCPHSPMEASPSLFGQVVVGTVHKVVVPIPPPTSAISSALNVRAPLRINTLFWSSILFLSVFSLIDASGPNFQWAARD